MKISIGCDHGALELKNVLVAYLTKKGYDVKDFGTYTADSVSITANKVKGIRCALLSDVMSARLTREHNDTNMMAIGAGVVGQLLALQIVDTWLGTAFSGDDRHQRRINKLMAVDNQ